jgi:hypothetical protein
MATATESEVVLQIGEAAGLIWRTLAAKGPLSIAQLVKATGAPRDSVMQAVGWLAREDKLEFEEGRTLKVGLK